MNSCQYLLGCDYDFAGHIANELQQLDAMRREKSNISNKALSQVQIVSSCTGIYGEQ
jgi:hypothetical protein